MSLHYILPDNLKNTHLTDYEHSKHSATIKFGKDIYLQKIVFWKDCPFFLSLRS